MEKPPTVANGCLLRLFAGNDNVSGLLINLLEKGDVLALLRLNREMRENLLKSPRVTNKIYYDTCLRADKSMLFSFYGDEAVQRYDRDKVAAIYEHERLDWTYHLRRYNSTLTDLHKVLVQVVPDSAEDIVKDLARSLRDPDLPIPHLRHQTVGTYCNSTFQMLLAELNWSGKAMSDEWEPELYAPLKRRVVELAQTLKNQVESVDPYFLKNLRYRGQTLITYTRTQSLLLNLIQLLLQLIGNHLDSLASYFSALSEASPGCSLYQSISTNCSMSLAERMKEGVVRFNPESPFEFACEFVVRYRQFRNATADLEEKIGFVFQHFGLIFECIHPQYSLHPSFNLWMFMQKMWINKMKRFHQLTNLVYSQLFLQQLQDCTKMLVDLHQTDCEEQGESQTDMSIFNNKVQLMYLKQKKPLSARYSERKFGKVHPKSIYAQADSECENQIFADYTEYLVDVSINEYNVHWCGSTKQRLGAEYRKAEKEVLEAAEEHFIETHQIFQSVPVTKAIFEKTSHFLTDKIKPPTLSKILKRTTEFLSNVRINRLCELQKTKPQNIDQQQLAILKQWKLRVPDLNKGDATVEYFNQQRQITQDTGEQYAMFFDLDKHVNLQTLQSLAKDCSELGSEPHLQNLESYVSNDSTDLLDEPPHVNLSRINSYM